MIKISVITVCYNAASSIENTILSIINQDYKEIEYIIVDGNSKDNTIEIINKYKDYISKWISENDNGIYDAMNKGLSFATGDYVIFIGADDILYSSNIISSIVKHITDLNDIYYGNVKFKGTNHIHWGKFNKWKWAWSNVCHQAILYPKCIYEKKLYNLDYKVYADYAYNLNLIANGSRFIYINLIITLFNINGYSYHNTDKNFEKDKYKLLKDSVGLFPALLHKYHQLLIRIKSLMKANGKLSNV